MLPWQPIWFVEKARSRIKGMLTEFLYSGVASGVAVSENPNPHRCQIYTPCLSIQLTPKSLNYLTTFSGILNYRNSFFWLTLSASHCTAILSTVCEAVVFAHEKFWKKFKTVRAKIVSSFNRNKLKWQKFKNDILMEIVSYWWYRHLSLT